MKKMIIYIIMILICSSLVLSLSIGFNSNTPKVLINSTSSISYCNLSFNQTLTDGLYATIGAGADNQTWNQTLAETLFYLTTTVDTLINNNYTALLTLAYANDTTGVDNATFNQTLTDGLYLSVDDEADYLSTYNATYETTYNISYHALIDNASYLSTYNSSYESTYNETYNSIIGDNQSFNQTLTDGLYSNSKSNWINNSNYLSINESYSQAINTTTLYINNSIIQTIRTYNQGVIITWETV